MPKKWIKEINGEVKFKREHLLNHAANNWNLNQSYNVDKTSELIRRGSPRTLREWEGYYFSHAYQNRKDKIKITRRWIEELGRRLYIKLTEVVQKEIESVTEEECIDYMFNLLINRVFDGYITEKQTIYGQLQDILKVNIEPAPDEWDRRFNIDFYIKIKKKYIGLQIKPVGYAYITQIIKEQKLQEQTHKKFTSKYGGKVFYIYSVKKDKKKTIYNKEVIQEIKREIKRLS